MADFAFRVGSLGSAGNGGGTGSGGGSRGGAVGGPGATGVPGGPTAASVTSARAGEAGGIGLGLSRRRGGVSAVAQPAQCVASSRFSRPQTWQALTECEVWTADGGIQGSVDHVAADVSPRKSLRMRGSDSTEFETLLDKLGADLVTSARAGPDLFTFVFAALVSLAPDGPDGGEGTLNTYDVGARPRDFSGGSRVANCRGSVPRFAARLDRRFASG